MEALFGGILTAVVFCKVKKINFLEICDYCAPYLALCQSIGRWGNFVNQEAYGQITDSFLKMGIYDMITQDYIYVQPTFFYESLWCLLGFALLMIIRHFIKKIKDGDQTFIYFIWYGIGRFFIEGLREDSLYFQNFRISQIVSIILLIIGISGILTRRKRNLYYEGKENSNIIRI